MVITPKEIVKKERGLFKMSSISTISSSIASYYFQNDLSKVSNSNKKETDDRSLLTAVLNSANQISNMDGDTLELSETATATNSNAAFDFKDFLDKIKNGTVTESDLKEAQTALSQTTLPGTSDPIGSFLEKVKEGTVTESDLTSIQETLKQGPPPPANGFGDKMKTFLDKVKNGTVTSDDLASMQEILNQAPAGPQNSPESSSADKTDPLKVFLDKVKNGTVTTEDLTAMQNVLNEMASSSGESSAPSF
jgi:hypothetical protein